MSRLSFLSSAGRKEQSGRKYRQRPRFPRHPAASLSGQITNNSSTTSATYSASVTNATTSVSGPGLTSPVSNSASTLLSYGPVTIAPRTTLTIPSQTQTLTAAASPTLTG